MQRNRKTSPLHNEERNQPITTTLELTAILKIADKNIKAELHNWIADIQKGKLHEKYKKIQITLLEIKKYSDWDEKYTGWV